MKLNIKNLSVAFGILILAFLLSKSFDKKDLATFDKDALKIDTTEVNQIKLFPKAEDHKEIILNKENGSWFVEKGGIKVDASNQAVQRMLSLMQNIKLKRVAALDSKAWEKYEVSDSLGSRVILTNNGNIVADWWIGKFNFSPNTRSATSYVRKNGEKEVFAVNDLLSFSFNQKFNQWRNPIVLSGDNKKWRKLDFLENGARIFSLERNDSSWFSDNLNLDSTKVEDFLSKLSNLTCNTYLDDFNPTLEPNIGLIISGDDQQNFEIKGWQDTVKNKVVISSSLNKTNFFEFDYARFESEVFISPDSLITRPTS